MKPIVKTNPPNSSPSPFHPSHPHKQHPSLLTNLNLNSLLHSTLKMAQTSISCTPCQRLYSGPISIQPASCPASEQKAYWQPHHDDISGLCTSALNGCRICSDLWGYFFKDKTPEEYAEEPWFDVGAMARHGFAGSGTSFCFREWVEDNSGAGVPGEDDGSEVIVMCFGLNSPMIKGREERRFILRKVKDVGELKELGIEAEPSVFGGFNIIDIDMRPEKRWEMTEKWMLECLSSHKTCSQRPAPTAPYFPTRLIEVNPHGTPPQHRIVETNKTKVDDDFYLTLSYRWPKGTPPYLTTTANLPSRLTTGILASSLPAMFLDSFTAAQKLTVDYIWIDSLCIIQDSPADKAAEIPSMASVYRNALCNLSTVGSTTSSGGLTGLRTITSHARVVTTSWSGDAHGGTYRLFDPRFWEDRILDTELNYRGWVFQERALAARVLHFARDQVLWECGEVEAGEEYPGGISRRFGEGGMGFKKRMNMQSVEPEREVVVGQEEEGVKGKKERDLSSFWINAVQRYSRCELTLESDKLVAISGIAKVLQEKYGDKYVAGLWRGTLLEGGGLCWAVDRGRRTAQTLQADGLYGRPWADSVRFSTYRAPSWSWASVEGNIQPGMFLSEVPSIVRVDGGVGSQSSKAMAEIVDVCVIPHNPPDLLGEVAAGHIDIVGTMYSLEVKRGEKSWQVPWMQFRGAEDPVFPRMDQGESWDTMDGALYLPLRLVERRYDVLPETLARSDQTTRELAESIDTEGMRRMVAELDREDRHDSVEGIVVVPQGVDVNGVVEYRRVGFMPSKMSKLEELGSQDNHVVRGRFRLV